MRALCKLEFALAYFPLGIGGSALNAAVLSCSLSKVDVEGGTSGRAEEVRCVGTISAVSPGGGGHWEDLDGTIHKYG
jgi:hypothetical protein